MDEIVSHGEEERLDIVSEPELPALPKAFPLELPEPIGAPKRKTVRVLFGCCNIYVRLPIPKTVLSGKRSSWRVHCVRCGRLTELPVD